MTRNKKQHPSFGPVARVPGHKNCGNSGYDFFDEVTVHAGQTHVASAETESASGMVYAKEMKHGGMKIVDVISIFDRLVSKVVRTAHTDTLFTPPPANHMVKPKGLWSRPLDP